jgi:hypothetical protein
VDDFGIKVSNMSDFTHLKEVLTEHYTVTVDHSGSMFCSIRLEWDHVQCCIDCLMPGYMTMILAVHMDASSLSNHGGKSRVAGHFYLTNQNDEDFNN